jgi:4-hydroxy-tetrahydrodipicolinate synthase
MDFEGIYTPVVTPHFDDHSIDEKGLEAVIELLIEKGINGLIVAGTTGEYYAQSKEERMHLMKLFKSIIGDRIPLIVGTGALRTEESREYAETAAKLGADALLVATPPYSVPTERENALHALAIDRAANLPIMLYNYPGRMGVNMGEEYLDRVGRSPNFKAIKESTGDIDRLHLLARDTRTSNWAVAWMIKHWSSSLGVLHLGCVPVQTLHQKLIFSCIEPAA